MKFNFELTFDSSTGELTVINKDTGEIQTASKKVVKKPKKGESTDPQVIREDNKLVFNTAAVELLDLQPGDKVEIKYDKKDKTITPVVGKSENFGTAGGNKVTKSFTVACRGKQNDELSKYGTVFNLMAHPTQEGIYLMKDNSVIPDTKIEDEDIEDINEDTEEDLPDLDLDDLVDNDEVTAFDFQLN